MIADDLTGAADCAASSAALGCKAVVLLYSPDHPQSEADWPDADILSIDANTRCLSVEQASESTARLIRLCESRNADRAGYVLFKKIDSTLRGNIAGEVAALLCARRASNPSGAKLSVLMAPALPAQGRTTRGGRLHVHGVPLEKTDIWRMEDRPAQSDILRLLADAHLSCGLIDATAVRAGSTHLRQAIQESAKQVDVVLCDAETDSDLRAIAEAAVPEPTLTAFVGSAGLASQIPQAIGVLADTVPRVWDFAEGPALFIVGTAASVSRQQARAVEAIPAIATFHATTSALLDPHVMIIEITQSLHAGRDVLVVLDESEHCSKDGGQPLPHALSGLLSQCAQFLGGLVATGGETARAALDSLGIYRLRLLGEVEPGLPFSVADAWFRPLPIITKAGAFGSPHAFIRCREFLRKLQTSARPSTHTESAAASQELK